MIKLYIKKLRMSGKENLHVSAEVISNHNGRYFRSKSNIYKLTITSKRTEVLRSGN